MAIISLVASGSRGDVQPYVALGQGLRGAGHDVRLLTSEGFESLVSGAGLAFHSTGPNIEERLRSEEWRAVTERGNFLTILARMRAELEREATGLARRLPGLLAGSDLIVAGTSAIAGLLPIAGQLGVPVVQAYLFPFSPTRTFPSPLVPGLPFGRVLNRLSFHAMRQLFWQSTRVADVAVRRELGLGKSSLRGPFRALDRSSTPVLYGYSPLVLPRPDDWPGNVHVTGYWTLEAPDDWSPPDDLLAFLDAGEPPVYIGFGSMGSRDPQAAGRIALEALARSGQRGILATGWGGLRADEIPAHVHLIGAVPHDWLFPRMAAVVHHGGAGTTAAGLRSGAPSIVVPFMGDQEFWGRRVAALGAGPMPIPRRQLDAKRLAGAIAQAVTDNAMRDRAADLGRRLRDEDGVAAAVARIDRFIGQATGTGG